MVITKTTRGKSIAVSVMNHVSILRLAADMVDATAVHAGHGDAKVANAVMVNTRLASGSKQVAKGIESG